MRRVFKRGRMQAFRFSATEIHVVRPSPRCLRAVASLTIAIALSCSICSAGTRAGETPLTRADAYRQAEALTELGRRLFSDPILSGSGKLSCASCHDPAQGFTPANAQPVQLGGIDLEEPGTRAVPALTYLQAT